MARRRRKRKGRGARFKNLNRSIITARCEIDQSDAQRNTAINQRKRPDGEGDEPNNFQVTEVIKQLRCEHCGESGTIVIAFNKVALISVNVVDRATTAER